MEARDDPAYGEYDEHDLARIAAAGAVRRLAHEIVRADLSTEELLAFAARIRTEGEQLQQAPDRIRNRFRFESPDQIPVPDDRAEFANSLDRPVSGRGNPWSMPLRVFRQGDTAVTEVTLGRGHEGAPERSHGGIVAAIYDDLLGFVQVLHGKIAFTAYLTVTYKAPTPIGKPLQFSAWVDRIEGKKLYLDGECRRNGEVLSSCEGLFIDASEYFVSHGASPDPA